MASEDKIFLDTDGVLDHLADRQPFAEYAHRLLGLAETGKLIACVSALSFSNLYYILRKLKRHADTLTLVRQMKSLVQILPVTDTEITSAFSSSFKDFEDAIQYFAAKPDGHIIAIVTRNRADYSGSHIPVMSPDEFIATRATEGESD
jgi:predicted nucleic acid-binding protein